MTDIQLIAVDVDGTLLRSDGTPAPQGMAALQAAVSAGVHVVLTSARIYHSMLKYYDQINYDGPMICIDGAQIWGKPGDLWQQTTFPREIGLAIAAEADQNGWPISTSAGDRTYYRRLPDQALGEFKPGRWAVATNGDTIPVDPLRIVTWDSEAATHLSRFVNANYADQLQLSTFYYEDRSIRSITVMAPQASKGAGVRFVADKLGIPLANTLAIGDGHNDMSMFTVAGVSVAMGNGLDEVRATAAHIAPSNDDEGLAWAVREFVF